MSNSRAVGETSKTVFLSIAQGLTKATDGARTSISGLVGPE